MKSKDFKYLVLNILFLLIIVFICINNKYVLGNSVNYNKELDILRLLKDSFLDTKKILPTFININGEYMSIFHLAKYGIVNPVVILSYFININLRTYYSVVSLISLGISSILLYKFLYSSKYSNESIFLSTMFIIISVAMISILCNSILDMLILPYIIYAFIASKERLETGNIFKLGISVFLIGIVNYTFLIPVIICLIGYAIYLYYFNNKIALTKKIVWYLISFMIPILSGVLLASFVLIPVLNINMGGVKDIISINYNINIIMTLGILYGLFSNKKNRYLSILSTILIILFSKYYVCYVVLLSLVVNNYIDNVLDKKNYSKIYILGLIVSILYLIKGDITNIIGMLVLLLGLFLYRDSNKKIWYMILVMFYIIGNCIYGCTNIKYYNKDLVYDSKHIIVL